MTIIQVLEVLPQAIGIVGALFCAGMVVAGVIINFVTKIRTGHWV